MMLLRLFLLCALALAGAGPLAAQPGTEVADGFILRHWSTQQGLPTNSVTGLAKDARGFLWITTNDGLVRFDGQQMQVYNRSTTAALPTNRYAGVHLGADSSLWLWNRRRYFVRYHNGAFSTYPQTYGTSIPLFEADSLWLGSRDGLHLATPDTFATYHADVITSKVNAVVRDPSGTLWVATSGQGVVGVAPEGGVTVVNEAMGLPSSEALALHAARDGTLWIGTASGLARYRPAGQLVVQQALLGQAIGRIEEDAQGKVWLQTFDRAALWHMEGDDLTRWEGGIGERQEQYLLVEAGVPWIIRLTAGGSVLYRDRERIARLPGRFFDLHAESAHAVWVATDRGLYQARARPVAAVKPAPPGRSNIVYALAEADDGSLWVPLPAGGGLARIAPDGTTDRFLAGGTPRIIVGTRDGTWWLGGSLCRFVGETCRPVRAGPGRVPVQGVAAAFEDRQGRFWVNTSGTLWEGRADQPPAQWRAHPMPTMHHSERVQVFYETTDGALLMGTSGGGLLRLLPTPTGDGHRDATHAFERLTEADGLASNHIRDVHEDHEGLLWIATEDNGLCRLDRQGQPSLRAGTLQCLGVADGLYTPGLHRLLEDDAGRFWFNTNQGLFWVARDNLEAWARGDTDAVSSVAYTDADGMPDREGNGGVQNAGLRASDGRLYFPTMSGLAVVDPANVVRPDPPTPYIETARVGGDARRIEGERLMLSPGRRNVVFGFTAPEFTQSRSVRFQYRLRGYDDWQDAEGRTATYTNLPPARYVFEVRAGLGGVWSTPAVLPVVRQAFFWETWGFRMALLAAFIGLVALVYRRRLRRATRRQSELERAVEVGTAELREKNAHIEEQAKELQRAADLKSRFLTNISHEFRTPLTLTFGPLDDALNGTFADLSEARPHFERARRNGSRLLRLINQLLDLSQLGAGAMRLDVEGYDLATFVRHVAAPFAGLAEQNGIHLRLDLPDTPLPHAFDRDKLEKVLMNLMSNAFKFTPPSGTITLALRHPPDGAARIDVIDTGMGIAAEHLPHLFERFYQADTGSTRRHEGSGVGLALTKELIALHGGTIAVESTPGQGTRFTVYLPDQPLPQQVALPHSEADPLTPAQGRWVASGDGGLQQTGSASPAHAVSDALVLIVEDNADMRAYLRAHLAPHFRIEEAADGQAGLEQARTLVPDLVLADVMMPRMDGLSLCHALKTDRRTSHVPLLLLSAKADVADRIEGYDTGADAYLAKPFDAAELVARVRGLLAERARLWASFGDDVSPEAHALPPLEAAFLADVDAAIGEALGDPAFTTDRLADAVHLSRRQLQRKLKAVVNEAPGERLRRQRLERAAALLAQGEHNVKQVAFAVGFQSEAAFSRSFRQHFGEAPSAHLPVSP